MKNDDEEKNSEAPTSLSFRSQIDPLPFSSRPFSPLTPGPLPHRPEWPPRSPAWPEDERQGKEAPFLLREERELLLGEKEKADEPESRRSRSFFFFRSRWTELFEAATTSSTSSDASAFETAAENDGRGEGKRQSWEDREGQKERERMRRNGKFDGIDKPMMPLRKEREREKKTSHPRSPSPPPRYQPRPLSRTQDQEYGRHSR